VHDGSLGSVLQSTGPPGGVVVLHDGSFGVVLQSIGPSGGGDEENGNWGRSRRHVWFNVWR
jgi:hypothetical protein